MKEKRVRCKNCKRYVLDGWMDKLRHMARHHPELLLGACQSHMATPGKAEELGAQLAQQFTVRLSCMFNSARFR